MFEERERIAATAPEDVDTSHLNPRQAEDWEDIQWVRAERSGMTMEPGFRAKVFPDADDQEEYREDPDEGVRRSPKSV